ncbi:MAG: polysaccharide deacetylase family protein [Planctomycetota bacterium]
MSHLPINQQAMDATKKPVLSGRPFSRRRFLGAAAAFSWLPQFDRSGHADPRPTLDRKAEQETTLGKALIAITLDLEMSRNFPTWEETHWDYEKGNLNEAAKAYTVEACRRVKAQGGVVHCFAVGRVFEHENVDWLMDIVHEGHPVGNHTYDHVYVLARDPEELQFRFRRAPWLIHGKRPEEVIRENIVMTNLAIRDRLKVAPAGFRTPGGFADGLAGRPDIQALLKDAGFSWVSSKYPAHKLSGKVGETPPKEDFAAIIEALPMAQPFVYPNGLVEIPMSPISDINAFRTGRWPLAAFKEAIRQGIEWAIERRAVFDFLAHPSCLGIVDPHFETIEMICDLVRKSQGRAAIVDLETIAQRTQT